jgi:DNA-binding transcriptional regulator PaaX
MTKADEKIEQAKENIEAATRALSEVFVEKCWGHDEFNEAYKAKWMENYHTLIDMIQ